MVTITLRVLRSRLTSSTTPWKFEKGPSMIRTASPRSKVYFGFGFYLFGLDLLMTELFTKVLGTR